MGNDYLILDKTQEKLFCNLLFIIVYSYKEDNKNSNSDKLESGLVETVTGTAEPGGLVELSFPNFKQRIKIINLRSIFELQDFKIFWGRILRDPPTR